MILNHKSFTVFFLIQTIEELKLKIALNPSSPVFISVGKGKLILKIFKTFNSLSDSGMLVLGIMHCLDID